MTKKISFLRQNLKICFLTAAELAHLNEIDSDVINDLRTDCFVTKPVNTTDLIDRLKVILSQE